MPRVENRRCLQRSPRCRRRGVTEGSTEPASGTACGAGRETTTDCARGIRATSPGGAAGQRNVTRTSPSATSLAVAPPGTIACCGHARRHPHHRLSAETLPGSSPLRSRPRGPCYITQCGYVTAVVLSPEFYRGLVRLARRDPAAERAARPRRAERGGLGMAAAPSRRRGRRMRPTTDGRRTSSASSTPRPRRSSRAAAGSSSDAHGRPARHAASAEWSDAPRTTG